MRKLYSAILALAICLTLLAPGAAASEETYSAMATNDAIVLSNSTDLPDAHLVHPAVYKIEGSNYFRLRDLAMLLRDSERQFAVDYDAQTRTVTLRPGQPYAPVGGELSGVAAAQTDALPSNDAVCIDCETLALTVYKIDGANYFKLRDLGRALDFFVGYDGATQTVYLSGARGYRE